MSLSPRTVCSQAPTVNRIIEAAIMEFGAKGEEFAKIENIAARAGISKQLIYYYYKSKKELYDEAINTTLKDEHSRIFSIDFNEYPVFEALNIFYMTIWTSSVSSPHLYVATEAIHRSGSETCQLLTSKFGKKALRQLEEIVHRGRQQGVFKADLSASFLFFHMTLITAGFSVFRGMMSNYLGTDFQDADVEQQWRNYAEQTLADAARK